MKTVWACCTFAILGMVLQCFGVTNGAEPAGAQQHSSGLLVKVTMRDGAVRQARIQGAGCTETICSRTAIKARAGRNAVATEWFDSLAAIRDTTLSDALFVLKDGSARRLSLLPGWRVLYFEGRFGTTDRVDLASVRSIEAVPGKLDRDSAERLEPVGAPLAGSSPVW